MSIAPPMGKFSGDIEAEWLPDGVNMRLLSPISYTDRAGRVWAAHTGFVTDGASIPRELWSLIGSPFTGQYRTAAVLHDAAYQTLGVSKDDADLMLRDASIELGCPHWLAEVLYKGVHFGGVDAYAEDQRQSGQT